jgi:hypothetical protein
LFWGPLEWNQAVTLDGMSLNYHSPLSLADLPSSLVVIGLALLAWLVLRIRRSRLPPLLALSAMALVYWGMLWSLVFIIQLAKNLLGGDWTILLMCLLPLNFILCALRLLGQIVAQSKPAAAIPSEPAQHPWLRRCQALLAATRYWPRAALILAIPILAVIVGVLILLGQRPDGLVRGFTDTADWTFSQKIPPPPLEYHGHYLCTVALKGHPRLVKPLRLGQRRGCLIAVNRQLCVANAFEELVAEKLPPCHRAIRAWYDRHGYPLSRHITSPGRADALYLAMKPLEWAFLLVLYTFDARPEARIARQYPLPS